MLQCALLEGGGRFVPRTRSQACDAFGACLTRVAAAVAAVRPVEREDFV